MGQLLEAIEQSTTKEIEAGGMLWRVKKIASADLARVGHCALGLGQGLQAPKPAKKRRGKKSAEDAEPQGFAESMAKQPVEALETMAKLKDAVVAAGLVAVGDPETDEWEDVQGVLEREKSDAKAGRLWVGSIPNEIGDLIFEAVMDVSTNSGEDLANLRRFRGESGDPAAGGSGGQALRKAAK
jgi:hypothetical protein